MRLDRHAENYSRFMHLGCIKILVRCYLGERFYLEPTVLILIKFYRL
jgi:hypothetical protein